MGGKKSGDLTRILKLAQPEWPWLFVGLLLLVVSLIPFLLLPVMIGRILDALIQDSTDAEKEEDLNEIVIFLLAILGAGSIFALMRSFTFNTAGERVVARLRIKLFTSIINQEIG